MSNIELTTRRRIVKEIELLIIRNSLKAGDGLPSERDLSEMLKTSRRAVREALVALDAMGVVEIRPRSGCYLKVQSIKKSINGESPLWYRDDISPKDIFQLRQTIERESAILAVANASQKDLVKIDKAYECLAKDDAFIGGVEDRNFHLSIAAASGNVLYERLLSEIWAWGDKYFMWDTDGASHDKRNILSAHNQILEALKKREMKAVIDALIEHFVFTHRMAEFIHQQFEVSFMESKHPAQRKRGGPVYE
jgi:GntR family transcriptional repressor for pyruvate dehydrogenase complex